MGVVRLQDDRTAGGECGRGVAAGDGECEGEVAGSEHRYRPDRPKHAAQVWTGAERSLTGVVDDRLDVAALAQCFGEQLELVDRSSELTIEPFLAETGLLIGDTDQVLPGGLERARDFVEKSSASHTAELLELRSRPARRFGHRIDLRGRGLS